MKPRFAYSHTNRNMAMRAIRRQEAQERDRNVSPVTVQTKPPVLRRNRITGEIHYYSEVTL